MVGLHVLRGNAVETRRETITVAAGACHESPGAAASRVQLEHGIAFRCAVVAAVVGERLSRRGASESAAVHVVFDDAARAVAATAGADGDGAVVAAVVGEGPIGVAARTLENRPISSAARAYFD